MTWGRISLVRMSLLKVLSEKRQVMKKGASGGILDSEDYQQSLMILS